MSATSSEPVPRHGWRGGFPSYWRSRLRLRWRAPVAALLGLLIGAGVMHVADRRWMPVAYLPLAPTSVVAAMRTDGEPVAVKGQVAEIFGNRFVLSDGTGRALIDTGPAGDGASIVSAGEAVTVEGRFERGALHAAAVSHGDGRVDAFGPPRPPGPPRGPHWMRAVF